MNIEKLLLQKLSLLLHKICLNNSKGCWNWTGGKINTGYGSVRLFGKHWLAHRLFYTLYSKEFIPRNLLVLHKCDNRICCNPEHLFLGTDKDNHDDKINKGRSNNRETPKEIKLKIIELYNTGNYTFRELGEMFNLSAFATCKFVKNSTN